MIAQLPKDVVYLLNCLNNAGYEAYVVGGCVRDSLLGRSPKDWDITTSAKPLEVKEIFPHTFDTGIAHGTVTVVKNQINYEITTYRIDGDYHDCRRPDSVCFTANLQEDLRRRDFTMNAIAYHPALGFQDPYEGQEDIKKQIIRGVGDSAARFQEDALRMLRCLRFSAQLGFVIESKTYEALVENRALIQKISAERIREELEKLLLSPYLEKLPLLWESGLLAEISSPVAAQLKNKGDAVVKQLLFSPADKVLRFTLFLQYVSPKEGATFLKRLKPDSHTLREVTLLLENLYVCPKPFPKEVKEMAAKLGVPRFLQLMTVQEIAGYNPKAMETEQILLNAIENKECISLEDLAISGNDLMEAGVKQGRAVGAALQSALQYVHAYPRKNEVSALLEFLKSYFEE